MSVVNKILTKVFGSNAERELKRMTPIVETINELEPEMKALSDDALVAKTPEFKKRLEAGESLDDILPEVFAVCREGESVGGPLVGPREQATASACPRTRGRTRRPPTSTRGGRAPYPTRSRGR